MVPIRPKPPAFVAPVIIEEDIVDYLVRASVEQRWRILSRVALATAGEPAPESALDACRPTVVPPAPAPGAAAAAAPAPEPDRASATPPPLPTSSSAPPPPASEPRPLEAVDRSEGLFQAMRDMTRLETAQAGARFCLEAALEAVPCLAGLVHLRDPATLDLVVAQAEGPRADAPLGTRTKNGEALVARAVRAGKPTVVAYGDEPDAEKAACERHAFFDPWSVALVPVMHQGRLLGLLELIDPLDGKPFDEAARSALAYVAARFARFLAERAANDGA